MTARLALLSLALLSASSCFKAWDTGGPWACTPEGTCADGLTCDDGVCCKPDGTPRCPTLPFGGTCPPGSMPAIFFRDADRDGAGAPGSGRSFCRAPVKESWSLVDTDCDDNDPAVGPLATERCNAQDDDCDGEVDDGLTRQTWYRDDDGDGFGEDCASCRLLACTKPAGYAPRAGDCGPQNKDVFPGAPEACNDVDDNCNGPLNDPPYSNVETPGVAGVPWECATGLLGACASGGLQCVFDSAAGALVKTCVPRALPATDVCGVPGDEDCSGADDDRPGCGGPRSFLTQPGLTIRAVALPWDGGVVPPGCLGDLPGERMAWLSPSWIGNGAVLHVLSIDAAPGMWWDLSRATRLKLPIHTRAFAATSGDINFGTWNEPGRDKNPIVRLCGDASSTSYQAAGATPVLATDRAVLFDIPLRPALGDAWLASNPGFDFSRVRRLELIVTPEVGTNITFTARFLTDAGTIGFE